MYTLYYAFKILLYMCMSAYVYRRHLYDIYIHVNLWKEGERQEGEGGREREREGDREGGGEEGEIGSKSHLAKALLLSPNDHTDNHQDHGEYQHNRCHRCKDR